MTSHHRVILGAAVMIIGSDLRWPLNVIQMVAGFLLLMVGLLPLILEVMKKKDKP